VAAVAVTLVTYLCAYALNVWRLRGREIHTGLWIFTVLWAAAVVAASCRPLPVTAPQRHLELVPFAPLWSQLRDTASLAPLVLNVAVYVPLGSALVVLGLRLWMAVGACVVMSFGVEAYQWFQAAGRQADINDVLLNGEGALLGAALAALAARHAGARAGSGPRSAGVTASADGQ
jgi:glycopeptide antibiotics resistance protein